MNATRTDRGAGLLATDTQKTDTQKKEQHRKTPMPDGFYHAMRGLSHLINRGYWRVTVEGAQVPAEGPVILAPVHRSFIDFFVVSEVTRRRIFYMAKDELWNSRLLGMFLDSVGVIPVHREGTDRTSVSRAQAVLEDGETLVVFPEGTRRSGPVITDLHYGTAFLASRTGAAIVPVGIGGSAEALPKGAKLPHPVEIRLVVGHPILPRMHPMGERTSRSELRRLTETLRSRLQENYDLARAAVASRKGP